MKVPFIPVSEPQITPEDIASVTSALSDGWISGESHYVTQFENDMCLKVGRKYGIAVSNGSVALDLTIEALNLQPGDEVILPSFTIISCLSQLLRKGVKPIFVDADSATWNMQTNTVESLVTSRTKAILAVHIYGLPCDMNPLADIAIRHGIPLIEDAAEAHGLLYYGKQCGSFGFASTFSFYANKNVTTGEGGMILTDNLDFAQKIRSLRNLGFSPEERFVHKELGWNSRLSSIQCALGISQLKRLDKIILRRQEIAARYLEAFSNLDIVQFPVHKTAYATNNYWVFGMVLNEDAGRTSKEIRSILEANGIGTRPFFFPLHRQPVLKQYGLDSSVDELPIATKLGKYGFYIPNGLAITEQQQDCVIEKVSECLK